jgi:hypothetical protein
LRVEQWIALALMAAQILFVHLAVMSYFNEKPANRK